MQSLYISYQILLNKTQTYALHHPYSKQCNIREIYECLCHIFYTILRTWHKDSTKKTLSKRYGNLMENVSNNLFKNFYEHSMTILYSIYHHIIVQWSIYIIPGMPPIPACASLLLSSGILATTASVVRNIAATLAAC